MRRTKKQISMAIDILDRASCDRLVGRWSIEEIGHQLGAKRAAIVIALAAYDATPFGTTRGELARAAAELRD